VAELLPLNWFQNRGRRHLGFLHYVNFDGKSVCVPPLSACVSNSVQMHVILADLWPKMWFSIWPPPPSWILLDSSSQGKVVLGPYSGCLYQIWCKSLHEWRRNAQYWNIRKLRILRCFLVNKGLISHVAVKICKENFNIHTVDIRVNKMSPYLSCSSMGKWNCNES